MDNVNKLLVPLICGTIAIEQIGGKGHEHPHIFYPTDPMALPVTMNVTTSETMGSASYMTSFP
jgi:hypothetical protein